MCSVKALSTTRNYIVFDKKRFRKKINTKMFRIVVMKTIISLSTNIIESKRIKKYIYDHWSMK